MWGEVFGGGRLSEGLFRCVSGVSLGELIILSDLTRQRMGSFVVFSSSRGITLILRSYISHYHARATYRGAIVDHETAAALRISRSDCTRVMLQVFVLCAFDVVRNASNRFAFNRWCSATIL